VLERASWSIPRIFTEIAQLGNVADEEMDRVFNLGIGMAVVADPSSADDVCAALRASGHDARPIGVVDAPASAARSGDGAVGAGPAAVRIR
jgi:phosphoribosylformylglycinamidine cyclo-ligase